jgi:hypothetical protein
MWRLVIILTGFAVAVGVGSVFLVLAALFDPATRDAGFVATMNGIFLIVEEALGDGAPEEAVFALAAAARAVVVAVCVAPLAVVALIGEAARARALVWYSGACGLLAAAAPWIARAARGLDVMRVGSPVEGRFALLFFLTGIVTGAIYWLIAAPAKDPALRDT